MPPTPYSTNGVVRLSFDVVSQPHHIDWNVELDLAASPPQIIRNLPLVGSDTGATVAQTLWDGIRSSWPNTVLAPTYTVFRRDAGALIPVDGGSLVNAGSSASPVALCSQATLTFRDQTQYQARLQLPETVHAPPQKAPASATGGAVLAIFTSLTATPSGTNLATWVRTRTGEQYDRGLFFSSDLNDKYRRARGL